ncbi:ATP-binding protein [Paenibacillus rhizoplanae]
MEPAVLSRLGEPYFSSNKTKGTGLGLMVTFRIIEAMEGEIRFMSKKRSWNRVHHPSAACRRTGRFQLPIIV